MEEILVEFISTLDISLKNLQLKTNVNSGFSKLTINQLQYINSVNDLHRPTVTDIADHMQVAKSSVTNAVNKLVRLRILDKTQSKDDKRVFYITLTNNGTALIQAKLVALQEYGAFIRSALSEEETHQFTNTLEKLVKIFNQNKSDDSKE